MNFKEIHIGKLIERLVEERKIENPRICNFLKCKETDIQKMYHSKSLDAEIIMRWSKLLKYDFFRIYSQHLILFSPPSLLSQTDKKVSIPQFKKNIYTQELIDFIINKVTTKQMSNKQVIEEYRIPKTTLYKWIKKNQK